MVHHTEARPSARRPILYVQFDDLCECFSGVEWKPFIVGYLKTTISLKNHNLSGEILRTHGLQTCCLRQEIRFVCSKFYSRYALPPSSRRSLDIAWKVEQDWR